MKNIYFHTYEINRKHLQKAALSIRLDDGSVRAYTYAEAYSAADTFAANLHQAQLGSGDRIAIIAPSSPEWIISYLAIAKIGATSALIDASLDAAEIERLIKKSNLSGIISASPIDEKIKKSDQIPVFDMMNSCQLFATSGCSQCSVKYDDGNENLASIIFSSGTTRSAAGIMHTHDSLIDSAQMCINANKLNSGDHYLALLPNSHIYGVICQMMGPLLTGADVCFLKTLSGANLVKAFAEYHPSVFPSVPKIYDMLKTQIMLKIESKPLTKTLFATFFPICLNLRTKYNINLGKVIFKSVAKGFGGQMEFMCSAGAPISVETANFFYGTGLNLLITYGATETNIPTIGNYGKKLTTDTAGIPYPDISVKIAPNGELLFKSAYVMVGYYNDPQTTKEVFTEDGWFKSGDLGYFDANGRVHITGRCKENIVLRSSKKIAPDDIEAAYAGIDEAEELIVCGVPTEDDEACDEVHIFIKAKTELQDKVLKELSARKSQLAPMFEYAKVHFMESIPKTTLQKPKRYLLQEYAKAHRSKRTNSDSETTAQKVTPQDNIEQKVRKLYAEFTKLPLDQINGDCRVFRDHSIDSLDALTLICAIETETNTNIESIIRKDLTFDEMVSYIENNTGTAKNSKSPTQKRDITKTDADYDVYLKCRNLLKSIYKVNTVNEAVIPEDQGFVLCANHVTNIDYLFLTTGFSKARFMKFGCLAKKELFNGSFLSKKLESVAGMIMIDRGNFSLDYLTSAVNKLKDNWGLLIFPEGTRTPDGTMKEFKSGAAAAAIEANVPVIPVYARGTFDVYSRKDLLPKLFKLPNFKKYEVDIIYGDPIDPSGMSMEDLTEKIRIAINSLADKTAEG